MPSGRVPTLIKEVLKAKLTDITEKQMDLFKTLKRLNHSVAMVEKQVKIFISEENYMAKDAVVLAENIDSLLDKLTKCCEATSCLNLTSHDPSVSGSEVVPMKPEITQGQNFETDDLAVASIINTDSSSVAVNTMQVQIKDLQQQMFVLQKLQNKNLVTQSEDPEDEKDQAGNDARMKKIETAVLFIQDLQSKDNINIKNIMTELSNLRKDIISMQDDISRLDIEQADQEEIIRSVRISTDNLRRQTDFHKSVSQTDELAQKVSQLRKEVTTFTQEFGSQLTKIQENTVDGHKDAVITLFFVAVANLHKVRPGERISFPRVRQEWHAYNATTSIFEAPIEGIYFFAVSISTNSKGSFTAVIMFNNNVVAFCGTSGRKDEQTSTSVILKLAVGDKVWIEAEDQTIPDGVEIGGGFSNFIGCHLK